MDMNAVNQAMIDGVVVAVLIGVVGAMLDSLLTRRFEWLGLTVLVVAIVWTVVVIATWVVRLNGM